MARQWPEVIPSRVLNDRRGVLGLDMSDLAAGIFVFMGFSWAMDGSGLEPIGLVLGLLTWGVLSPIRLATRRKTIRDWCRFHLTRRVLQERTAKEDLR